MNGGNYRVSFSRDVANELRDLGRIAMSEGRYQQFPEAATWIAEELERTPHEFGESREEIGSLAFRCGCAGTLYVAYAIDESEHVVFIRRFALVKT